MVYNSNIINYLYCEVLKRSVILFCFQSIILTTFAQDDSTIAKKSNRKKLLLVAGANAAFYTGSFIALNKAWYADYDKTTFHFFNDNPEWNQMDKAGHAWSTYHVSRLSNEMWKWSGVNTNTAAILSGVSGMAYQSIIEIQDAYSAEWGFSWGDVAANVAGAGLFVLQELNGRDQKLTFKLSYFPKKYPSQFVARRDQLFGSSYAERILKDYNSQTYWLSANISALFPETRLPNWLNLAVGYGADGMYGGRTNMWTDAEGAVHDHTEVRRSRIFYLSPDVDLTRIPTNSKLLRSVFFVLNVIKVPAPALELKTGGRPRLTVR
jgi:hypothetical protein